VNFKKESLVLKNTHYLFNQTPGAKGCLITKDGDELAHFVNADAVKKYFFVKKTAR
jgi:hypothetical protein